MTLISVLLVFGAILLAIKGRRVLKLLLGIVLSLFGWLAAQLHLHLSDRLFLNKGRLPDPQPPSKRSQNGRQPGVEE